MSNRDLIEALHRGSYRYVTDFPDEELLKEENVIGIPHLGASTPRPRTTCAIMAATQLRNFLQYGIVKNSVNFPDCEMEPSGRTRIVIANKNVPNMVGQITTILAEQKINIADMLNKSRGDLALNIIDIDNQATEAVIAALTKINGVIMARVI